MKLNNDLDGTIVKSNETYVVVDNTVLDRLVVSKTTLYPGKETSGHSHDGQEEVYQFICGSGTMEVGLSRFPVCSGDVVLIPSGDFHKVWNSSTADDLVFICVFDGKRTH